MKTVFIDLEFCDIKNEYATERSFTSKEIIEIGAVKLNEKHQIIDRFDAYVKPQYGTITSFITDLTRITEEDVAGADCFAEVMDSFLRWIGPDEVKIYSWGYVDRLQIQRECQMKAYENERLIQLYHHWMDFQNIFAKKLGINQQISLLKAVYSAAIDIAGRAHSAISDAENTARLYALTKNKKAFESKKAVMMEIVNPKPALSVSIGSLLPDEVRARMKA